MDSRLRLDIGAAFGGPWTPYVPALSASGSAPSGFRGSGSWWSLGSLVVVRWEFLAVAGMSPGSGSYSVSLPLPGAPGLVLGSVVARDASSGAVATGIVQEVSGSSVALTGASGAVGSSVPWTWAAGDSLAGALTYEARL